MESVDSRLLKWLGELMVACSSKIELWENIVRPGNDVQNWSETLKSFPGLTTPPLPVNDAKEIHRQWLALFNAVPKYDYDILKERLATVEEECGKLRHTLNEVTKAMSNLKNLPETMVPWLEITQDAVKSHMEWLSEIGKSWWTQEEKIDTKDSKDKHQNE